MKNEENGQSQSSTEDSHNLSKKKLFYHVVLCYVLENVIKVQVVHTIIQKRI